MTQSMKDKTNGFTLEKTTTCNFEQTRKACRKKLSIGNILTIAAGIFRNFSIKTYIWIHQHYVWI